jgi:hypothetical protein
MRPSVYRALGAARFRRRGVGSMSRVLRVVGLGALIVMAAGSSARASGSSAEYERRGFFEQGPSWWSGGRHLAICDPSVTPEDLWSWDFQWRLQPSGTVALRFEITSSDSTTPISAVAMSEVTDWWEGPFVVTGDLWDGARSTGPQVVDLPLDGLGNAFWGGTRLWVAFDREGVYDYPAFPTASFTYKVTPLDAAGNPTSFVGCPRRLTVPLARTAPSDF